MSNNEWFADWFDTNYYHTLYKNRDDAEAQFFMKNLLNELNLDVHTSILDLACGKGRHSIYLKSQGYHISGCDLSTNSIEHAKSESNNDIDFFVHDMRNELNRSFDCVLNLFTSFGYFDNQEDNVKVFRSIKNALTTNGKFVIDFLNADKVIAELVAEETKEVDGINFEISRKYTGTHIIKDIAVIDNGTKHHYQEKVQALKYSDFQHFASASGFRILKQFGNFSLDDFNNKTSDRLILVFGE